MRPLVIYCTIPYLSPNKSVSLQHQLPQPDKEKDTEICDTPLSSPYTTAPMKWTNSCKALPGKALRILKSSLQRTALPFLARTSQTVIRTCWISIITPNPIPGRGKRAITVPNAAGGNT